MGLFSQRNGYQNNVLQPETTSQTLINRVFAEFYRQEYEYYDTFDLQNYTTGIENMMIELGVFYQYPDSSIARTKNAESLRKHVCGNQPWYFIYDFIEKYIAISNEETREKMVPVFNRILEEEVSAYRIVNNRIAAITTQAEREEIASATTTPFDSVNTHIKKALELFADRQKPDYENSIKESISAIESICSIISGKNATLNKAIVDLKNHNVHIHPCLEAAFKSLYNYTSDEKGIRHAGMDFVNAPAEDAKYMLVSCSAFVNYLIEKWTKNNGG